MFDPRPLPLTVRALVILSVLLVPFLQFRVLAFPQQESTSQNPPKPADATEKSSQAPAANDNSEVTSHDTPATFKVRVNLVLVRVVVRDSKGKEVSGLKKEDFQLFDNRKPQTISSFSVETPEARTASAVAAANSGEASSSSADVIAGKAVVLPQRFVAMVFDDLNLSMEDATFARSSADKFLAALAPSDRLAMFTTSGQVNQDFTDNRETMRKTLLGIHPRSVSGTDFHDCPDVSYYQADLIQNQQDSHALAVATEDAIQCAFSGDRSQTNQARSLAIATSARALSQGDNQTSYGYRHLEEAVKRLGNMPGQRVLVLVSPGFILSTLRYEASEMISRAARSSIVINTIDARGLYTPDLGGDIASPAHDSLLTGGPKSVYRVAAQAAQQEVLAELALGTGGTFFHNRNDIDEGMRLAAAAPAFSYLLGFSPQNLKIDGRFHNLKVSVTSKEKEKYAIQARNGYFAPRTIVDPAEAAKEEIQEALFSQDEVHDIPCDLQTQFFKKDDAQARIAVLTRLDLRGVHFRKTTEGRNHDNLVIVTGIFDENGNYVTGQQKTIEMKLRDTTYDRLTHSGLTVKSSFDVKPGTYMVRLVVRDAEGAQMAARNGAVVIPF